MALTTERLLRFSSENAPCLESKKDQRDITRSAWFHVKESQEERMPGRSGEKCGFP